MTFQLPPIQMALSLLSMITLAPHVFAEALDARVELDDVYIEKLDDSLGELIDESVSFELLAEGFEWSEGPVWMLDDGGYLLFTDVWTNRVYRWDQKKGVRVWIQPSGYTGSSPDRGRKGMMGANGLGVDKAGQLLLCQHGDRRIARLTDDNTFETVADRYMGKRFNSPNDLAVHSDGSLFFTDPPFGLRKPYSEKEHKLGYNGVFRVGADGAVSLIADQFEKPNGIALSPDESTLYVGSKEGDDAKIWAFSIDSDGQAGPARLFFDATPLIEAGRKFALDGMKVDEHGNLWATGPYGILIIAPTGKHLGTIRLPNSTANCCFGGADGKQFFITSDSRLIRVNTLTRDATWKRRQLVK